MMKKILRVCMGLALVLVIAGCSNSKQAKSESKTDSASSSSITAKKSTTKSKPTNQPKINGVIVVATGAKDLTVKETLYSAVQTALQVQGHQVEIYTK